MKTITRTNKMVHKRNPDKALVLNSSYMATHIINSQRAFVINYKGNAEVLNVHPDAYFGTVDKSVKYPKPSVIRINKWIKLDYHKVPLTRENILRRDNYRCVYCGHGLRKNLTLDHVLPRAKGGVDAWDNLVTCCKKCNSEKGSLLIDEWGKEHPQPIRPHHLLLVQKQNIVIPDEWKPYLFL